jgi:hypothetical protein
MTHKHDGSLPHTSLTSEGTTAAAGIARRHGVSVGAVAELFRAMNRGQGRQAQFNHPDLGGMGQWSQGGMLMLGDMFNNALKAKVAALCKDVSTLLDRENIGGALVDDSSSLFAAPAFYADDSRWPAALGQPSSSGSQNDMHYAVFPQYRRLAIEVGGKTTLYDTGDHEISGFGQQQGSAGSLTLTTSNGLVRIEDLAVLSSQEATPPERGSLPSSAPAESTSAKSAPDDARSIFDKIEGLADCHAKNLLSDEEYRAKKAELLARL